MRINTIFDCVKKLSLMFAVSMVLILASCSNINNNGLCSVRIAVGEKIDARTAVADVALSDFIKFTLTCDGTQKGTWQTTSQKSAYEQMTSARIQLTDGSHEFVLTAEDSTGVSFKDTITQVISGDTILNFSLKLASIPTTGNGSVKVTVDFTAIKDKASMMYCMLYESGDETDYKTSDWLLDGPVPASIYDSDSNKFTFTASDIPAGQHILAVSFYDKNRTNTVIGVWTELVTVLPGRESKSEYQIKALSKVYNITYYLDGNEKRTDYYSTYTDQTSLYSPSYDSNGYTFSGWYTKEDYTGDTIQSWEPFTKTGDISLYGKLIPKTFNINYYNTDGTAFSGTHKEGYPATHTYGTDTVLLGTEDSGDLVFAGWYTGTRNDDGTVTLGTSRVNTLSKTGYTGDIDLFVKYAKGVFHVSADGSDASYVDDATAYGEGSTEHPFATLSKAVSTIAAQNIPCDYRIVVHGNVLSNNYTLNIEAKYANSITIEGAAGNETDSLDGNNNSYVLRIETDVPVTIKKIKITNGSTRSNYCGGGITLTKGTLTLADGALIKNNKSTYAYNTSNWSSYGYMYGGGGITVKTGTLIMEEGAEISSNTSQMLGGGVFVCGYNGTAAFVMNGGVIKNNSVLYDNTNASYYGGGGGIYVYGYSSNYSATFTMNGGVISNNTVPNQTKTTNGGGGIYAYNYANVTVNGGTISGNSGYCGGGIYNRSGSVTLAGGTISSNVSTNNMGGAVYGYNTVKIKDSAYIPAGVDGKNDVYHSVIVTGNVTAQAPVATITPNDYYEGCVVLTGTSDMTLTQEIADKFALKSDGTLWNVVVEPGTNYAVLKRPVYSISYKEKNGAELSEPLPENAPVTYKYNTSTTLPVLTKEGYTFQGWYTDAECKGEKLTVISGTGFTSDLTLYTYWTKEVLLFTIDNAGIELTKTEAEDGTVTITAVDGFTGYSWKIDYGAPENAIIGASVSADGKTLTFSKSNMIKGISYVILVTASDSGNIKQSATVSVKKQEAE